MELYVPCIVASVIFPIQAQHIAVVDQTHLTLSYLV